ncbi:phm7-similarity to hyp1 [Fusarium albosuccineum]|uniref:Phm7-similarity to hyp1 n=1 Tax=Fusarium albosuccineum TaxID=1237068 RepID=A0A8H4L8S1_9HYPO|nr:phm7-similarity to hyp1 [Fusarium albosuccineum]
MYDSLQTTANLPARTKGKKENLDGHGRRLGGLLGGRSRIYRRGRPKSPWRRARGLRHYVGSVSKTPDTIQGVFIQTQPEIPDSDSEILSDVIPCTQDSAPSGSVGRESDDEEVSNLGRLTNVYTTVRVVLHIDPQTGLQTTTMMSSCGELRTEGDSRITITGFVHMIERVSSGTLRIARAAGNRLPGGAQNDRGIGVISFLTAIASPHERPERQRFGFVTTAKWLWNVRDEDTIKKCGLDAYFFLRYLRTLLAIFLPIAMVIIPVLVPLNYIGGRGSQLNSDGVENSTAGNATGRSLDRTTGLDTLAWGNVRPASTHRYWAHLSMSVVVVTWVCFVFFHEMKRPSARTVLVSSIPASLCTRERLRDLFFLFPGGVENVWVNRDFSSLTEKMKRRNAIHRKLEEAETLLIKSTQRAWRKTGKPTPRPGGGVLEVTTSGYERSKSASGGWVSQAPGPSCVGSEKKENIFLTNPGSGNDVGVDCENHGKVWPWWKTLSRGERPCHRLPLFGLPWLPGVAPLSKKVDTIDWCREQLDALNSEIELLQKSPEDRFPLLDSAFIQFNTQVAAHMACQSEIRRLPEEMTPRIIGFCPKGVIWANLSLSYRASWLRSITAYGILLVMISLWSIPVAWTGALSQIDQFIEGGRWGSLLEGREVLRRAVQALAGLLPTILLALFLYLLPLFLELLAEFKGVKTHALRDEFVQKFYFAFLYIQIFLVVSIASFFTASIDELAANVGELQRARDVLDILSRNLPKAANYFFSYMILQSLSASSATLLQVGTLITRYAIGPLLDSTPRAKWLRHTSPVSVRWSAVFPAYTNLACIALTYCVISPLISAFAILTFGLLWAAQRYMIFYVYQSDYDTGGVLYPRALNQTFTGVYVMELCLAGLFFIVKDENGRLACTAQGVIMILLFISTVLYQVWLNRAFAPLFHYLPIEGSDYLKGTLFRGLATQERRVSECNANDGVCSLGYEGTGRRCLEVAADTAEYSELPTRLEDVPEGVRDMLVRTAFEHEALRARRPTVWIPKDDLGISDWEVRQTMRDTRHVSICNRGTSLDGKGVVRFELCPPDQMQYGRVRL